MKLYAVNNWGSMIVELVMKFCDRPFELILLEKSFVRSSEFAKINPLKQIPTLVLSTGEVLTESLAICHYVCATSKSPLLPAPDSRHFAKYLRWSVFLVGSVYSTAPFADHPDWFVTEETAQEQLHAETMRRVKERLLMLEQEFSGPWFLGSELSLIDLYLCVMSDWDPGREWFEASCPKLIEMAHRLETDPMVQEIFRRNRPTS